jgi:hypothetical protein
MSFQIKRSKQGLFDKNMEDELGYIIKQVEDAFNSKTPTSLQNVTYNRKYNQIPTGTIDGSNKIFRLPPNFISGTEQLSLGVDVWVQGVDYTISGNVITATTAPALASNLRASFNVK